ICSSENRLPFIGLSPRNRLYTKTVTFQGSTSVAAEHLARSFAFVRTATQKFYERHVEPNDRGLDQRAKVKLLSGFLRVDCGVEAVAQDITELLNQLREIVPELPPLPPL
ncbi:hypothetical protein, partial [Acidocella aromatica]|uniref:hypothetical protein n=1 Tax=Acidocella aromatica TaxID=1303579 RepID=UPI001C84698D